MGGASGPQTGAEIEAQAEVGVAGRVRWDCPSEAASAGLRLPEPGFACRQPLSGSSGRLAMVSG